MINFILSLLLFFAVLFVFIRIFAAFLKSGPPAVHWEFEDPVKRAGKRGERWAAEDISSILNEDDTLLTNVELEYDGSRTEIDLLVINKHGIFPIEVKYYNGTIYGNEDDYEWLKDHTTYAGNTYTKTVRNPIKQVKREVYILHNYLRDNDINIWIDGYAMIIGADSPVDSPVILENLDDADKAIHTRNRSKNPGELTKKQIEDIVYLLTN